MTLDERFQVVRQPDGYDGPGDRFPKPEEWLATFPTREQADQRRAEIINRIERRGIGHAA